MMTKHHYDVAVAVCNEFACSIECAGFDACLFRRERIVCFVEEGERNRVFCARSNVKESRGLFTQTNRNSVDQQ